MLQKDPLYMEMFDKHGGHGLSPEEFETFILYCMTFKEKPEAKKPEAKKPEAKVPRVGDLCGVTAKWQRKVVLQRKTWSHFRVF